MEKEIIKTVLRVPSETYNIVKSIAKSQDRSINYMIVKILNEYIEKEKSSQDK